MTRLPNHFSRTYSFKDIHYVAFSYAGFFSFFIPINFTSGVIGWIGVPVFAYSFPLSDSMTCSASSLLLVSDQMIACDNGVIFSSRQISECIAAEIPTVKI